MGRTAVYSKLQKVFKHGRITKDDMEKKEILKELENTFCRLKPSKIEGVGVFAVRDIPKNTKPFGTRNQKWIKLNIKELEHLDKEVLKMIDDFFVIEKDGSVEVPEFGLNGMDISFFVNNSDTPNLITKDGGYSFITLRDVKAGEELTVRYETYDYKYKKSV